MKKLATILSIFLLLFSIGIKAQSQKPQDNLFRNIVLFWDTSLSMQNKNLAEELNFLDNFISDKKEININLVKFSNAVNSEKTYKIEKANWNELKQQLIHTVYDGATSYLPMLDEKYANYDAFLLFTDGYQNEAILKTDIKKPLFVISSNPRTYFQSLELKTLSNKSQFINLNKIALNDALAQLGVKEKIKLTNNYTAKKPIKRAFNFNKVTGYVYGTKGPLEGVNIKVAGKNTGAVTNTKGFYSIAAKNNDKLTFSYLGFKTYTTTVSDPALDIHLLTNETRLKAVEIRGKQKEKIKEDSKGLASDKNKKRGYAVQTLTSKNFSQIETNVAQNVRGKVSGLSLGQDRDLSMAIIRGYNTIIGNVYPLIVLDGVPLRRSDSSGGQGSGSASKVDLSFIDPNNVAKINVLKGLAATNQYGTLGRNGVIEIITKTATYKKNSNKPIDRALLQNNIYKDDVKSNTTKSQYISKLQTSKTAIEAYNKYLTLRDKYAKNIAFYFDVSDYFKQWGNGELSRRILSNVLELNYNNPVGLLALSFKHDANNNLKKKIYVDRRLLRLRPKNAQSYLDMADDFVKQKKLTKAFYLYKSMLDNNINGVDFTGVRKTVVTLLKNLVQNNQNTLPTKNIDAAYFKEDNINARLYFEWTNPDMEFEIQFVNPQKRFFSWIHARDSDAKRIQDEKTQGFTSEEFLLIDAAKGDWLVNLTNLAPSSKNQILKVVLYKNYGKPQQTRKIKVIDLRNYNKKASLIRVKI